MDKKQAAVITQYDQWLSIYVEGAGNSKKEIQSADIPSLPVFIFIFLASSEWPSVTEGRWPSRPLADRPVSVANQPVTRYGKTGGAPEKCWDADSYHRQLHQLCTICPDAVISWKRRNPAGKKRRGAKINVALRWQHQKRVETEHPAPTSPGTEDQQ